jgi:hypothetical protein
MRGFRFSCLLVAVVLLLGCQTGSKRGLAKVMQTADYHPDSLQVIAYIGAGATSVAGDDARALMETLFEDQMLGTALPFVLLSREEVERRVAANGARTALDAVQRYWRDAKKVDKFEVAKLGAAVGAQAILLALVDEWGQIDASQGSGDASYTRVGASLMLYSVATGRCLWRAKEAETMKSESLEQDMGGGSEQNTARSRELRRSAGVQSLDRGPAAPRFEVVGAAVAATLVQALAASK